MPPATDSCWIDWAEALAIEYEMAMVIVRPAVSAAIPTVVALWKRSAGPTRLASDEAAVERLLARDPEALLVAEAEGELVGTVVLGWDGWRCHLYRMAVDDRFRRAGIASQLIAAASERARQLGARRLDAMVTDGNAIGVAFWKGAEFEIDALDHRWSRLLCD